MTKTKQQECAERGYDDLSKPNLLPYGITPSAPSIQVPDVDLFKTTRSSAAVNHFKTKVEEIRKLYEELVMQVKVNDMVYRARYNFVPLVGQVYHLYEATPGDLFLSLIEPEKWTKYRFVGSYRFGSNDVWEVIE